MAEVTSREQGKNPSVKEKVVFLEGNLIEDVPRKVMEKGMKSVRDHLSAMDKVG